MSHSDSLLVEDRSRYAVLVIDGDQRSGCNSLEALRGMDVTWVTSLEDARTVLSDKKCDFILSGSTAAEEVAGSQCKLVGEILTLAYNHNTPICFVERADSDGIPRANGCDHITFRAATKDNLAENMLHLSRANGASEKVFRKMKCACTMAGTVKTPNIWFKAFELLQAICMKRPVIEKKSVKTNGQRLTPIPRK